MMREKSGFDDGGRWKKKTVTTESIYSLAPKGRSEISRSEKENRVHFGKGNKSGESGNFGTRCASYPETGGHVLMPFLTYRRRHQSDKAEGASIGFCQGGGIGYEQAIGNRRTQKETSEGGFRFLVGLPVNGPHFCFRVRVCLEFRVFVSLGSSYVYAVIG